MDKKYDIILFGSSGFTGQITAEYLSEHAPSENVNWAIAGRNKNKLLELIQHLKGSKPDIIIADIHDDESIKLMTSQCSILMNAAGPFVKYGKGVVQACIASSTHYLDITGEPSFIADIYNNYSEIAKGNETCIVNCCGFDSIPADFAAWLTARKLPKNEPKSLKAFLRTNATFSGGTLTTAIEALHMETLKKSIKTKIKRHPDAPRIPLKVHFSKEVNAWAIPMPVVDPHIVKRSAHRMPEDYGVAVSYAQFFVRSSLSKVIKTIMPIAFASVFVRFKYFRNKMLKKFKPGTGPSAERRANSRFEVICYGTSTSAQAVSRFSGADPGYDETAKMFSQSAFTLLDKIKDNSIKFGVLTPVEALGMTLVDRLRKEGILIE